MTYQTFVNKVGFGSKGYSFIANSEPKHSVLISGIKIDYSHILEKLNKITNSSIKHIKIGKERKSIEEIKKISQLLLEKNFKRIFAVGGGSIIDFTKNVYLNLQSLVKDQIDFYIIPSRIGSGAESSLASIIITKNRKIIKLNDNFIPKGIVYDLELLKNLNNTEILLGSVDALSHCVESLTSFNKNPYLDFFSISTINNFFIKVPKNCLFTDEKLPKNILIEFCILSLNGGIAQNNSGSGLCHALAHSAEQLTGVSHPLCISYFMIPILKYISKVDSKFMIKFNFNFTEYFEITYNYLKKMGNFKKIEDLISTDEGFKNLINLAKDDPCWRLFYKKIDMDVLKSFIIS